MLHSVSCVLSLDFSLNYMTKSLTLRCFLWYWDLNLGPHSCWAGTLSLEPCPSLFFLLFSYCLNRVFHFYLGPALVCDLPNYAYQVAEITNMCHREQLIGCNGALLTFWPGWTWTVILLIFMLGVAGITGMCHNAQQKFNSWRDCL
jgi:hypothetical protein